MATDTAVLDDLSVRVAKLEEQMKTLLPPPPTTTQAITGVDLKDVFPTGGARRRRLRTRRNVRKH